MDSFKRKLQVKWRRSFFAQEIRNEIHYLRDPFEALTIGPIILRQRWGKMCILFVWKHNLWCSHENALQFGTVTEQHETKDKRKDENHFVFMDSINSWCLCLRFSFLCFWTHFEGSKTSSRVEKLINAVR